MNPLVIEDLINAAFDVIEDKIPWRPFGGYFLNLGRATALKYAPLIIALLLQTGKAAPGQVVSRAK